MAQGTIVGTVRDPSSIPVASVTVRVVGTTLASISSSSGGFSIAGVPVGPQTVQARLIGYRSRDTIVTVVAGQTTTLDFTVDRLPITLADIVVTPGYFGVLQDRVTAPATLSRQDIETMPQLGEDIYRSVNHLPGMASSELSARFSVRGGPADELLVRLDGLELFEPFHLKDFDAALSILDVHAIGAVDLTTGGFTAEYGNHQTGTLEMRSLVPPPKTRTALGLSITNVRGLSEGTFADGAGNWLLSVRRGYLDIVLKLIGNNNNDLSPRYYDGYGKLEYRLGEHHAFALHLLRAGDNLTWTNDDDHLTSGYGSTYGWATWRFNTDRLAGETVVAWSGLDWSRAGDGPISGRGDRDSLLVNERRTFRLGSVRQDWSWTLAEPLLLKFGVDARQGSAQYDYVNTRELTFLDVDSIAHRTDTTDVHLQPSGTQIGLYIAPRVRPIEPLTVEAGLRYDRNSYVGEHTIAPRINVALALTPSTTLRAAWGYYYQAEGLYEIPVQDGERTFFPSARAEQRVAGLEQRLGNGMSLRIEAYNRVITGQRPRYFNYTSENPAFPEIETDRARMAPADGDARGIEVFVRRHGERTDWSASYALARVADVVNGVPTSRKLDQRHTVYADVAYRPAPGWNLSAAVQVHSGWPYTPAQFTFVPLANGGGAVARTYTPLYGGRLPVYHRLDLRVTREVRLKDGSLLSIFADLFNVYDRGNVQGYFYNVQAARNGIVSITPRPDLLLPILPSIGVSWEF